MYCEHFFFLPLGNVVLACSDSSSNNLKKIIITVNTWKFDLFSSKSAFRPPKPMQSLPTEKIMKKPIPDEHLILKTTFEGLIQKCLAAATDPVSSAKFVFS